MASQWTSFGIGVVTGMRSMTGSAALSWASSLGRTRIDWIPSSPDALKIVTALAVAEMAGDKTPFAPDRRMGPSLVVRLVIGAVGGAAMATPGTAVARGVLPGVAGAVAGTLIGRWARGADTRTRADWFRALMEDAVAAGLAATLVNQASRSGSVSPRIAP